jgi:hypothetical protein
MNPLFSGGLLATSMLLGQTQAPTPPPPQILQGPPAVQPSQPAQRPFLNFFNREDRPILNKIQGWFKREPYDANMPKDKVIRETPPPPVTAPVTPATTPGTSDFPRKLPNPASKAPAAPDPLPSKATSSAKPIEQTIRLSDAPKAGTDAKMSKSPILARLKDRIGRDENFAWITGQFEIENGTHILYYATPETLDKFNGRIVLTPQQVDLTQFRSGDLVCVHGQLVQSKSAQSMTPAYRVTSASAIERAKQ